MLIKNFWVNCEETVEKDKCQLRNYKWQVSSELKNDMESQQIQKMRLAKKNLIKNDKLKLTISKCTYSKVLINLTV